MFREEIKVAEEKWVLPQVDPLKLSSMASREDE